MGLASSSFNDPTTMVITRHYVGSLLGLRPASSNLETCILRVPFFTLAREKSPMRGRSHLLSAISQLMTVAGFTRFRFLVFICFNQTLLFSRKVTPLSPSTTFLNRSTELAPNEFTISTFRRSRSGLVKSPGPDTGQILILRCTRWYCPGTSNRNLTRYQPPSLTIVPA